MTVIACKDGVMAADTMLEVARHTVNPAMLRST